jgi:DNA-binding PadR family transcriptional regulator
MKVKGDYINRERKNEMILQVTEKEQNKKLVTRQNNYYNFGKTQRFSHEYTILAILEYFYLYSRKVAISKYHIMTKINEIKTQRPDRISLILIKLEKNGYIESIETPNAKFYLITDKGFDAYLKWIKDFLTFVRNINNV